MFDDKIEREDLEKMSSEYVELLGRVLTIQADCEIGGPHLYVKNVLLNGPHQAESANRRANGRRRNGSLS